MLTCISVLLCASLCASLPQTIFVMAGDLTGVLDWQPMKRFILSLLVLTALALYANTPPTPDGGQVGRYQCTAGTLHGMTKAEDREATFRIDTATGKAWMLQAVPMKMQNGGLFPLAVWIECHEVNGELYKAALASLNGK